MLLWFRGPNEPIYGLLLLGKSALITDHTCPESNHGNLGHSWGENILTPWKAFDVAVNHRQMQPAVFSMFKAYEARYTYMKVYFFCYEISSEKHVCSCFLFKEIKFRRQNLEYCYHPPFHQDGSLVLTNESQREKWEEGGSEREHD